MYVEQQPSCSAHRLHLVYLSLQWSFCPKRIFIWSRVRFITPVHAEGGGRNSCVRRGEHTDRSSESEMIAFGELEEQQPQQLPLFLLLNHTKSQNHTT